MEEGGGGREGCSAMLIFLFLGRSLMAYVAQGWSLMNRVGKVTLHCKKCNAVLATRETVMLAKVPPSSTHLAVREGMEEQVEAKLSKFDNEKGGKSTRYCPYIFRCRECDKHVANLTKVAGKLLICFKIENIDIFHNGKKITANKLSEVHKELEEECGIEVVNVTTHAQETGRIHQSRGDSKSMVYCDTSGLNHTSREIDSLTRLVPRDYQRELFLSAMRGNTLVYLPTGSGKTLIAAMVMSCMKKLNPSKVVVFLVDRVPLAYQQSEKIKSQLTGLTVETLVGEMESPQNGGIHKRLADNKVDVLILTHQIFLNFLAAEDNPPVRLSDVSVLVLDEAHHCSGHHPYNKIMEYYKTTPNRFKPVVLGLSASPAGELEVEKTSEKLKKLLENLDCKIAMPIESDWLLHVNIPDVIYERSDYMNTDQVILQLYIEEHIKHLIKSHLKDVSDRQRFEFPVFSSNFRGALRKLIDSYHGNKKSFKALTVAEHAMHLLSVVEFCEVLGYQYAVESLKECVHRIVYAKSPKDCALKKLIGSQPNFQALVYLADQAGRDDHARAVVMSDRYKILEKHIKQFLCQAQEDPTSRGIVFVSLRKTTFKLCEQIRKIADVAKTLNPYPFVGHGQGSYDGMRWKDEQEKLLKEFKKGICKLLICTSVLEEGLDVPECNLVVRFEGAATLRAMVQTRGRASRRRDSKFVVICNEKQERDARNLCLKEQNMEEAIRCLMDGPRCQSQADEFGCEVRKPKLFLPGTEDNGVNTSLVMRHSPRISVMVHNMVGEESRVIDFLNDTFDVISSKPIQSTSSLVDAPKKKTTLQDIAFELEPSYNKEAKEFRSKEEFTCHVTEAWCTCLTDRDEEPLPVWLQAPPLEKRRRSNEPFHWLKANSLCLGTFVSRCHFQCEWPLETTLKNIKIHFDHSFKMLTLHSSRQSSIVPGQGAVARGPYKIEFRYDEIEDFIIVDSDSNAGIIKIFLTARHPPRLYRQLEDEQNFFHLAQIDEQDDEDDSVVSSSEDDSETEGLSTDEEYADVITADFHDASPDVSRNLADKGSWERASDFHNGENAVSQCFTYCVTIPFNELVQLRCLLTTVEKRFHKSAFYCRVKESYGKLPEVNIPDRLPFDVKYAAGSALSFHPLVRGRVPSGKFGRLLLGKSPDIAVAALEKLSKVLEKDKFCDPGSTLESLLKQNNPSTSGMFNRLVPGHCALIKRAVITPTRLLFYPPEVMVKNRVLRNYDTNDFLCVSIRDEDLSKMSAVRGNIDDLLDGMKLKLDEGIEIAGQRFQFLGSSNSQLRNHSCWFVGLSSLPDDIRRWMGKFTNIK